MDFNTLIEKTFYENVKGERVLMDDGVTINWFKFVHKRTKTFQTYIIPRPKDSDLYIIKNS